MRKRNRKCITILTILIIATVLWNNSLEVYARECPGAYSPTGYHDFNKHNMKESAGTFEWYHDVYIGERSGVSVYQKCKISDTSQWCEPSCCFCDMPQPGGRHTHTISKTHSLGCNN